MILNSTHQSAIIMDHLLGHKERGRAVQKARRVVELGGFMSAAFITRFASSRQAALEEQEWLVEEHAYALKLLESGIHNKTTIFSNAYFITLRIYYR